MGHAVNGGPMTGTNEAPLRPPPGSAVPRRHVVGLLLGGLAAAVGAPALLRRGDAPAPTDGVAGARTVLSRGRGTWTGTGSIAVLGLTRCGGEGHPGHADRIDHTDGAEPTVDENSHASPARRVHPRHQVWPDVVTIDVEVHNGLASAILFSPGQLRLQIGPDGPTVTPLAAGSGPRPAAGGSTIRTWVSYLAPGSAAELRLQYSEPGNRVVAVLALPAAGPHGRAS